MRHLFIALLIHFVAVLTPGVALSYEYFSESGKALSWRYNKQVFHVSDSFQPGPWTDALNATNLAFHNHPSIFYFELQFANLQSWGVSNGRNEITFSTDISFRPAMTLLVMDCSEHQGCYLAEADVVFFNGEPFTPSMNKKDLLRYGGSWRPFITTALHEFGHAAGLAHEANVYNIMGTDFEHIHVNGDTALGYLGEDASAGLRNLYGIWPMQDVSVSHWTWHRVDRGYSDHKRTAVYNALDQQLPITWIDGEPGYRADRGQTVKAEFTYENNGSESQMVQLDFYLSTDARITTGDQRLGGTTVYLHPGVPDTYKKTLTMPNNVPPRDYYLGVIVDAEEKIPEIVEDDNATYIPVHLN